MLDIQLLINIIKSGYGTNTQPITIGILVAILEEYKQKENYLKQKSS